MNRRPFPLDLSFLATPVRVLVPVLNQNFIFQKKPYKIDSPDGWQFVSLQGNHASLIHDHAEVPRRNMTGYTSGANVIFSNFDVPRRKWKLDAQVPLHFYTGETFEPVGVKVWEDRKAYFVEPWYEEVKIYEAKDCLEQEGEISLLKGTTPELRTVFLFHAVERQNQKIMLEQKFRAEEHERQKLDLGYRVRTAFERSGGTVTRYSVNEHRLIVDWTLGDLRFNSVLEKDTFRVIEAGYCMSGDDRRHNVTSLVITAQEYMEDDLVHITRY